MGRSEPGELLDHFRGPGCRRAHTAIDTANHLKFGAQQHHNDITAPPWLDDLHDECAGASGRHLRLVSGSAYPALSGRVHGRFSR
ncbi:MAG: hypothetical protein ACREA0_28895, partial [bacterium]